jgi:LemA protein
MEPFIIIIGVIVFIPLLWLVGTYNGLVRLRNHCRESWSDIDTELKRRHDLIPNLVETVKGYAAHERQLLESVVRMRARAATAHDRVRELCADENQLVRGVVQVLALAESYPDLKADAHFLELQRELVNTEDRIQAARRFYNANVRDLNNRVEMFPSSLVAGMFSVQREDFFEVDILAVRAAPAVIV